MLRAKDLPQEANIMDRVLQGGSADPDPFAVVEVLASRGSDVAMTKAAVRVCMERGAGGRGGVCWGGDEGLCVCRLEIRTDVVPQCLCPHLMSHPPKQTQTQESSRNPEFYNARYFLYVEDLETARLKITVKDKVRRFSQWVGHRPITDHPSINWMNGTES